MTDPDPDVMTKAMNRYDKAMQDFEKAGGYAAQSEATAMAASLGLPQEVMGQQLGTLSGGQRRRIELARILFSDADTLILDEPTNHLDADSIEWLRGYLKKYEGGFLVISHSTELLDEVVNKVWHLDAQLGQIDMYSLGWKAYLHQRVVDEERRRREREVAEKKAERLMQQGIRLHAKATKAVAAQNMMRARRNCWRTRPKHRRRRRWRTSASPSRHLADVRRSWRRTSPKRMVRTSCSQA